MGLFRSGSKTPGISEIRKIIAEKDDWQEYLKKELGSAGFDERWMLLKEVLSGLDRTKARDLTRLVLAGYYNDLIRLLDNVKERNLAIECLGYFPSRETVEHLVGLLSHKDDIVQISAAGALKNHTPRLVVPRLVKALLGATVIPARAGEVLLAMGYLAEEALLESFPQAPLPVKAHIIALLAEAGNPKCKPLVTEALKSEDHSLKRAALDAVARLSFFDLWPLVIENLLDPSWAIRLKTVQTLAVLGIAETAEYIELLLDDEDEYVRQCAQNCLRTLFRQDAVSGKEAG